MSSSESDAAEAAARSLALEQAYVHEVYEQCAEATLHASNWPRVQQFLEQLEPGAIVADIGCGNGKYLSVNHNVFKIGVDRCTKFTSIAREKDNEVLACDNLSLPFRDESFDAVLSIAVVHHFSTTERRVRALKELARVLRIGGRLVISVWAMEQKHRKFESQDVLVPWPKAYCINPNGSPMKPRASLYDDRQRGKNAQTYLLSKRNSQRGGGKGKSYWIDPIFSPSPSTSSLSSPNETCYSFFRRALQKLAGGRRNSRAWFLENWQNGSANGFYSHNGHNGHFGVNGVNCGLDYDDEDNVDELPIELRRLEEPISRHQHLQKQLSDSLSVKSKSVSNISELHKSELVRSRSSATGLCPSDTAILNGGIENGIGETGCVALPPPTTTSNESESLQSRADVCTSRPSSVIGGSGGSSGKQSPQPTKPRLVKQKTHFSDDACLDYAPEPNTAIDRSLRDIPETQVASHQSVDGSSNVTGVSSTRRNVHKQSSMNEELMSIERLKERESVRRNIMKQASLNEELMYKSRPTFEAFKDTLYSGSARFQLLKSGLTNRIKQSTTNIEKVSGMSIKNGFVRILQSWKSTESPTSATTTSTTTNSGGSAAGSCSTPNSSSSSSGKTPDLIERRSSREDGSDSSKDSSLQSDTSVDSEDSFASVIYIPKKSPSPLLENLPPIPPINAINGADPTVAPVSPLLLKQVGVGKTAISGAALMKRLPVASSKSLPPRSPPAPISPRAVSSAPGVGTAQPRFFAAGEQMLLLRQSSDTTSQRNALLDRIAEARRSFDAQMLTRQDSTNGARKVNGAGMEIASALAARPIVRPPAPPQQQPLQQQQLPNEALYQTEPAKLVRSFSCNTGSLQSSSTRSHLTRCSSLTHHYHYHQQQPQPPPPIVEERRSSLEDDGQPLVNDAIDEALEQLSETPIDPDPATNSTSSSTSSSSSSANTAVSNTAASSSTEDDESRARRLNEIKQLLRSKPGFASRARSTGAVFPLVRRANSTSSPSSSTGKTSKPVPKLASLELFNPETDDPDSDSSGVSSPESAGSVISVISDAEKYLASKASSSSDGSGGSKKTEGASGSDEKTTEVESSASSSNEANPSNADPDSDSPTSGGDGSSGSSGKGQIPPAPLLLQQTVDSIALKHASEDRPTDVATTTTRPSSLDKHISPVESTWSEECKRQLSDLTDRLNENLINDIDQFCRKTKLELENETDASSLASKRNRYSDTGRSQSAPKQQLASSNNNGASVGPGPVANGGGGGIGGSSCSSSEDSAASQQRSIDSSESSGSLRRLCSASTASLASSSLGRALHTRSASEETPCTSSTSSSSRRERARLARNSQSATTSTCSSSQESLPSDQITYHQYYHVFREGELEQLIDAHIDSLHIISSYYEHASWCLVAEKVQVWTI